MQLDAAKIDDPGKPRRAIDYDLFGGASGREFEPCGSQPRWALGGCSLLIKRLTVGAVNVPLEDEWAVAYSGEGTRRDQQIVADDV